MTALGRWWQRFLELPGVRVVHAVHEQYQEDRGAYLAASITYYLIVAVIPAALLGLSVTGFLVSAIGAEQLASRLSSAASHLPGLATMVSNNADSFIHVRTVASALAFLGLLWAGTGGLGAIRNAMSVIFRFPHREVSGVIVRLQGLAVFALLLLSLVAVSLVVGLVTVTGMIGAVAAFLAGMVLETAIVLLLFRVFTPQAVATTGNLFRGAVLSGIGIAILALGGSWYVTRVVTRLAAIYGTFAAFIGVLVLGNLTAVALLIGAEYAAWRTGPDERNSE